MKNYVTSSLLAAVVIGICLTMAGQAPADRSNRWENIRQLPATPWQTKGENPKAIYCPLIKEAPVLDGKLDDPCWKEAGQAYPFIKSDGGMAIEIPADAKTHVLLCRDDKNIYMAWTEKSKIAKENASSPKAQLRNDEGNYGDLYEVSFKMIGGDDEFRYFMNSKGNTATASHRAWDKYAGAFTAKSMPTADGAIIETAIPLTNPGLHVPQPGEWWRIRLTRTDAFLEWSSQNIQNEGYDYVYFGSEADFKKQELPIPPQLKVYGERYVYDSTDVKTQFVAHVQGVMPKDGSLAFQLFRGDTLVDQTKVTNLANPYVAFFFDMRGLTPGDYHMQGALQDQAGKEMLKDSWVFKVSDQAEPAIPFPADGVTLNVHEQKELPNGSWPISTGVPLPRGAISSPGELALFEDGKEIPANIVARETWFPTLDWTGSQPQATQGNSLRWVGVSFIAHYTDGKPHAYVLRRVGTELQVKTSPLTVTQDDNQVAIVTGPAKFVISKNAFAGVEAWLDRDKNGRFADNEKVLLAGGGPYVVDQNDKRYSSTAQGADPANPGPFANPLQPHAQRTEVTVEEQGPARVVVAVKGWYHDQDQKPLCIYNTRIIAYAGMPYFEVEHRTILTPDNRKLKLEDIGFDLKTARPDSASFGTDKDTLPAFVPGSAQAQAAAQGATWSTSIHQDRNDHFRLVHEWAKEQPMIDSEGHRADGQASVVGKDFAVSVILRDVWEKFPKELEASSDGLTLHFWPRHGYDAMSDAVTLSREHIHALWFDHIGKLLNLQLPDKALARIIEIDKARPNPSDAQKEAIYGYGPPGLGVTITNDFFVLLGSNDKAQDKPELTAGLVRQNPEAFADPAFACATEALDKIAPADPKNFPETEHAINQGALGYYHFVQNAQSYGMFIYAQHNTEFSPGVDYPVPMPRLWSNSHYQDASLPWLLYFRSGDPELLKWARAHTDNFMNIATCNYDDPDHPSIATNPDGTTKGFHVSMAGQMFHCKSPLPWGGPMANNGHFIDPQCYFMQYVLTGDYAGMDNFAQWGVSLKRAPIELMPHRDTNATEAHLIEYYWWSWDPYVLEQIHQSAVPLLGTAFARHDAGHFHKYWAPRLYELTRDPRVIERGKEWVKDVGKPLVDMPVLTMVYDATHDKNYLPEVDRGPNTYYNPEDPWNGYSPSAFYPYGGFVYSALPGGLYALHEAGLTEQTALQMRGLTPQGSASYKDRTGRDVHAEVLLLDKDGSPFEMTLENAGVNESGTNILVIGPDGRAASSPLSTSYDFRAVGPHILHLKVNGGKPGLYSASIQGGGNNFCFYMPSSGLPGEAAVLRPNVAYRLNGPEYCLAPKAGTPPAPITLEFASIGYYNTVGDVRLVDDKGAELLNTSLVKGLMRDHAIVTVDPREHPLPWGLEVIGQATIRFSQGGPLYLAPDKSHLIPIIEAENLDTKAPLHPVPAKN